MSSRPGINANVPQIPQPVADVGALANAVQALKQGVDSLAGYRGNNSDRAVTFNDLVTYGILDQGNLGVPANTVGAPTALAVEAATRASADTNNATNIANETSRATSAEGVLTANLASEVTRATTSEGTVAANLTAEAARAGAAEGVLTAHLATEVTRATTAEGTLTTNLASEVTNRTTAVTTVATAVTTETTRATTAEALLAPKASPTFSGASPVFALFPTYANDAAALAGGVVLGQLYWNATAVVQRRV